MKEERYLALYYTGNPTSGNAGYLRITAAVR